MRKWILALCIAAAVPFGLLVGSEFVDAQLTWRIPVKSGLTVGGLIHGKDRSNLSSLPAVATGQVLTSAGVATVPAWSASPTVTTWTLSGLTASKPVFTDASKALVSTGTLGADQGGTGLATYAVGDIPYASAATTISKLADVAAGSYLRSGGVTTAPLWSTATLPNTAVQGDLIGASAANVYSNITAVAAGRLLRAAGASTLPAYSTATFPDTAVAGDLLTATATNVWGVVTDVAAGSVLRSGGIGVVPAYSTTTYPGTSVQGDLIAASAANVYSNITAVAAGGILRAAGVGTLPAYSTATFPDTAVAGDLLTATATNVWGVVTDVAAGSVLRSGGVGVVPAYSTATFPGTAVAGDLLTATATNVWGVITDVAAGSVLRSGGVGVVPAYSTATFPSTAVAGDLLTATATNVWGVVTDVAAGSVLRSGGVGVVPAYSTATYPDTVVAGDLLTATATNVVGPITGVAVGQVLTSGGVGAVPAYSAAPTVNTITLATPKITAGSGTGVTVNDAGSVRTQVYKVTVANTNLTSAAVTHDLTIATLPAKTQVHVIVADVTTPFVCAAVCTTATLSATVGIAAAGVEYLESFDIDAAAAVFGDVDAEVGSKLDIAANTGGGYIPSWAGTSPVVVRFTSGTGNWGDGASATNTNAGVVTFYIHATVFP